MFERMMAGARRVAEARRKARRDEAAARVAGAFAGVDVEAIDEGILLSGRGLRRRMALDGGLRTIGERLR